MSITKAKHPELNLNEIDRVKEKYDAKVNELIKEFENEVGIVPYSGGLHVKGIQRIHLMSSTRYQIELEV